MSYSKIKLIIKTFSQSFVFVILGMFTTNIFAEYYVVCNKETKIIIEKRISYNRAHIYKKKHHKLNNCNKKRHIYHKLSRKKIKIIPTTVVRSVTPATTTVITPAQPRTKIVIQERRSTSEIPIYSSPCSWPTCQPNYGCRTCLPGYWNNHYYNQDMRTDDDVGPDLDIDY